MMETTTAGLVDDDGNQVALKGVHVEGHLEGLMLVMTLRQQYRNDTERNLETVYTFPLAFGATLLGLKVEIGGRRLHGAVIGAPEARERYEAALEDGDSPVMVEKASEGLFTANLGNLMPGESVVIELEYAQLLRFEQGRIRLTVPTVIAQRYGDPQAKGRLKPHETAAVDPLADYAFSLRLRLLGAIARARVSCPSHRISTALTNDGVDVLLERGGLLDRDFILNLENLWGFSCATRASDGPQTAVLASFCPDLGPQTPQPVALKVLVDCSGSMAGDSIESAKRALHDILQQLSKDDYFAYSRFGSTLVHHHKTLIAGAPANLPGLAQLVALTDANLGGTEMEAAVRGVLNDIKIPAAAARLQPAVLLITDGEIWAVEEMIRLAQHTSQRLFVIGVGAAPGETVLQRLAEHTGGAYEGVSPNEDMAGAIVRMFHRLRGAQAAQVSVDWGATPVWQSPAPRAVLTAWVAAAVVLPVAASTRSITAEKPYVFASLLPLFVLLAAVGIRAAVAPLRRLGALGPALVAAPLLAGLAVELREIFAAPGPPVEIGVSTPGSRDPRREVAVFEAAAPGLNPRLVDNREWTPYARYFPGESVPPDRRVRSAWSGWRRVPGAAATAVRDGAVNPGCFFEHAFVNLVYVTDLAACLALRTRITALADETDYGPYLLQASAFASASGDPERAERLAARAVGRMGPSTEPERTLAALRAARGDTAGALTALDAGVARARVALGKDPAELPPLPTRASVPVGTLGPEPVATPALSEREPS
jgi:uncharacterized protein YegL